MLDFLGIASHNREHSFFYSSNNLGKDSYSSNMVATLARRDPNKVKCLSVKAVSSPKNINILHHNFF